jgi:ABC-type branched-subunit amino acid transport system substrate-binding protein
MPYPFANNQQVVKEYRAAMKKFAPKTDISYLGMEMYIGCRVFEEGMKKAGANANGADLIKALENIGTLDLGGFVVSFGPENRLGSKFTDITVIGPDGTLMR